MKFTLLLLVVLFNYSFSLSFATLTNNSASGNLLENLREKQRYESNSSIGGNGTVSESKFSHSGGNDGHSAGEGSNGNNGQANTSPRGGHGAVIPVYAAGAAGQLNNHHSASNVNIMYGKDGLLLIILTTILTSFLLCKIT